MNNHNISDLVDLYILRCEVEGKSPATVKAYRWTLGRFLEVLSEDEARTDPGLMVLSELSVGAE
jgi:hypothetical protein